MRRTRKAAHRDQDASSFARILQNLIDATPGALGAVFVDGTGESVDYAGSLDAFDVRVAGAHMQLEFRKAREGLPVSFGELQQITVRARHRSYVIRQLPEGYMVIMVMGRCAGFGVSPRAIAQAEFDLRAEGGWQPPKGEERWVHARVQATDYDRRRPGRVFLGDSWHDVQVIGRVAGLMRGERGYRVRTEDGAEMTLVRERLGRWYADIVLEKG
jgi:hypothetical protein